MLNSNRRNFVTTGGHKVGFSNSQRSIVSNTYFQTTKYYESDPRISTLANSIQHCTGRSKVIMQEKEMSGIYIGKKKQTYLYPQMT